MRGGFYHGQIKRPTREKFLYLRAPEVLNTSTTLSRHSGQTTSANLVVILAPPIMSAGIPEPNSMSTPLGNAVFAQGVAAHEGMCFVGAARVFAHDKCHHRKSLQMLDDGLSEIVPRAQHTDGAVGPYQFKIPDVPCDHGRAHSPSCTRDEHVPHDPALCFLVDFNFPAFGGDG
jgi:hypothetical protein